MAPLSLSLLFLLSSAILPTAATDGTLRWDIQKNTANEAAQLKARGLGLRRRATSGTVQAELGNAEQAGLYYANVTVGTPPQDLSLQIDTGSSDVWVPSSQTSFCQNVAQEGCAGGSFDQTKSSTYDVVEEGQFNISYVDGTGASGNYFQDTFSIGGGTIKSFEMGIALETTIGVGIMGIGYNVSEANVDSGNGTIYPNLPFALADAGLINANAYSLWLNDLQATTGSILFGGVDTARYTGDLIAVDVYHPANQHASSFSVAFTSLSATSSSGTDKLTPAGYAEAAILDSGTTITLLPDDIVELVYAELGASVSEELGGTIVPCNLGSNSGTLDYGFGGPGGPVIKVAMSQLVIPLGVTAGEVPTYTNGETICQLGIQAAGKLPVLFGDTFLRSAYVVYDLDNNQIALAQTDFNATDSKVVAFPSLGATIPSASVAPSQVGVTPTATGLPRATEPATITGSGSQTYNPTSGASLSAASGFQTSSPSGRQKGAAAPGARPFWGAEAVVLGVMGAGVMVGMGGFALL